MIYINNNNIKISPYKKLCVLSFEYIKVMIDNESVCIHGKELCVEYYDHVEIRVVGKIRSIVYEDRI